MDAVLGLAFTRTGWLLPFFGTYIGWLGVALTGSHTSSNALFGSLQKITARQLNLSPILMCATNSAGGVMGEMVDAQSTAGRHRWHHRICVRVAPVRSERIEFHSPSRRGTINKTNKEAK